MKCSHLMVFFTLVLHILFVTSAPAGELDGFVVQGTMKQIIGAFSTNAHVHVGDTFELDLANLPKEKIVFTRLHLDPKADTPPNVPFAGSGPLIVENVKGPLKLNGDYLIRLSTDTSTKRTNSRLLIQVRADKLKKDSRATIYFYQDVFGSIICMAEAEGVLK